MLEVIAESVPFAVAIAASPFAVIAAILLLLAPRAAATGGAFLATWMLALAAEITVFALLGGALPEDGETPTWASWTRVALGALLLVLGVRAWVGRHVDKPAPAWMASLASATPGRAAGLALLLAVANPKVLLLAAAAGLAVGAGGLPTAQAALVVVLLVVLASLTVAAPILLYAVLGERVLTRLSTARDWLVSNNSVVMAVVLTVIGLLLLVEGVQALL